MTGRGVSSGALGAIWTRYGEPEWGLSEACKGGWTRDITRFTYVCSCGEGEFTYVCSCGEGEIVDVDLLTASTPEAVADLIMHSHGGLPVTSSRVDENGVVTTGVW